MVCECLSSVIQGAEGLHTFGAPSIEKALEEFSKNGAALFFLSEGGSSSITQDKENIRRLILETKTPVSILGDGGDCDAIAELLHLGAAGYISTDLSVMVVVNSLKLMLAGGTFFPANILTAREYKSEQQKRRLDAYKGEFTERQLAVLEALCKGKSNKAIANDLAMEVGTVKAHIHKLIKKLQVRNRTELALLVANQVRG